MIEFLKHQCAKYYKQFFQYFRCWATGRPHLIVGPPEAPYLRRWWIIPRNPLLNIYLHQFLNPDDARALHDHPWISLSLALKGSYIEHTQQLEDYATMVHYQQERGAGSIVFRLPSHTHRISLHPDPKGEYGYKSAWTLFITGPLVRKWGFACPNGWVPWETFVSKKQGGQSSLDDGGCPGV